MKEVVEKIFVNGKIYTMEAEGVCKEALCVKDGKIVFVGGNEEARQKYDGAEIDLKGKTVLPGMGDSHLHFNAYCATMETVNLGLATSKAEAIKMLAERAAITPKGAWIKGSNFDQSKWSDSADELPTRHDLDKASTDHPIVIKRVCLHTAVVNTKSLEVAKIGKNYDFGPGGTVELEKDGMPNGVFREQASKVYDEMMPTFDDDPEAKHKFMLQCLKEASKDGLTMLHTYAAEIWKYTEHFEDYQKLDREGKLPLRVSIYIDNLYNKPYITKKEMADPYRKVQYGGYKIFCDGSLGSRSAKLFAPYDDDPSTDGILVMTQEQLNEKVLKGYEAGLQIAIHCIGDKGLDCVVTAIENCLKVSREHGMMEHEQATRLPFRIIHAQMCKDHNIIDRMKKLPVVLDIQPSFLLTDLHWIDERVGEKRSKLSYLWKTFTDEGLMCLGGSDCPVEDFSPWKGMYAATTRKDLTGYPSGGYHPEEDVSIYEAACMFSKNIPYATGDEDYMGTLEPGKFADMIVIDRDIFENEPEDLLNVNVLKTYLAGDEVYSV